MPPHGAEPAPAEATGRRPGLVLLLVLLAGVGLNLAVIHPVRDYLLDFRGYYAAGRAVQLGLNPYDAATVRQHVTLPSEQQIVRYFYPPPTLALMAVCARLPYPVAQVPWCLLLLGLLCAALWLVLRALHCPLGSPAAVLIGAALLLSSAVEQLFRWGQFDAVVAALLAAAFLAFQRRRPAAAGVAIGLAAVAKVTPLLYLGVFLLRRDRRALLSAVATIAVLMGAAYVWLGGAVYRAWWHTLSAFSGEVATLISPQNMSLHGFVYRALLDHPSGHGPSLPWINLGLIPARLCAAGLCVIVLALTAGWLWRHRRTLSPAASLAATIPVALLVAPVMWTHYGVQLIVPLAVIVVTLMRQPRLRRLDAAWLVATLLCYLNWPVERFELALSPWLAHLAGPTMTYATLLIWSFMLVRYVPLTHGVAAPLEAQTTARPVRAARSFELVPI